MHILRLRGRNVPPNRAELSLNEVLPLTKIVELDANRAPGHYDKERLVEFTSTTIRWFAPNILPKLN